MFNYTTAPAAEYTTFEKTSQASNIRIGDVVEGRTVAAIKAGPKRVSLFDADGKRFGYFLTDQEVTYTTRQQTGESAEAQTRFRANRLLDRLLSQTGEQVTEALAKVTEQITNHGMATTWSMQDLQSAQVQHKVWHTLATHRDNVAAKGNEDGKDLLDLAREVAESYTRDIMSHTASSMSRSTSLYSNLVEDMELQAKPDFVARTRGY